MNAEKMPFTKQTRCTLSTI